MNDLFVGMLEMNGRSGGHLRQRSLEIDSRPDDPSVPHGLIGQFNIRNACMIECSVRQRGRIREAGELKSINGLPPEEWKYVEEFSRRTAVDPTERIRLSTGPQDVSMRIVDL